MQSLALLAIIPEFMVACMIAVGIREAWIGGRAWSNERPVWQRSAAWSPTDRYDDYTTATAWRR